MPDSLGRYTLSEMENRTRLLLDGYNQTLDANGNLIASIVVNFLVSNQDIDNQINESLIALYAEAIIGHEDLFAIEQYMDIHAGQLQYSFPANMLQLRWMRWKPTGLNPPSLAVSGASSQNVAHPYDYSPMNELPDPQDTQMTVGYYRAPTYRRNANAFILNDYPTQDNVQGILMNFIALPAQLTPSTATTPSASVIQAPFAILAQEVVIYDAAYKLAATKNKQVSPEIEKGREEWHQRFMSAVENALHSVSVSLISSRLISSTYSGRETGSVSPSSPYNTSRG
jgi:hypothetical protein